MELAGPSYLSLGILTYLIVHVWETANAAFKPELYEWSVSYSNIRCSGWEKSS